MGSRVELFEQIRRDRDREGLSLRALARRHGVHRRTVKQALSSPVPPARKRPEGRPAPRLGEYRGLPKCGQPVKYFHCSYGVGQYTNNNPFTTTWQQLKPDHTRVHSETRDGAAACDWDFFATHATMTLLKIPGRYWFIYEGTPGGALNVKEDFVVRPGGKRTALSDAWLDDVPWMLFEAQKTPFGLLLVAHQPSAPVSYVSWPYKPDSDGGVNQMTVAGFGRPAWQDPKQHTPPLEKLPAKFSIAITRGADEAAVKTLIEKINR
jgi:hypothetical protein